MNFEATALNLKVFTTVIDKTSLINSNTPQAGKVSVRNNRLFVTCGDGNEIEIKQLQPAGKRRMNADEFLRGARLPQNCIMI